MIWTDREIQIALREGLIDIVPEPIAGAYSSTAVDLTLHPTLSIFVPPSGGTEMVLDPNHPSFNHEEVLRKHTRKVELASEGYIFQPGTFVLAWTAETVALKLAAKIAARVEGKSSLARLGVGVHVTAPTVHAGFKGQIRLEMTNHGLFPVRLRAGMRLCQSMFEQTMGTASTGYEGRFSGQSSVRAG